MTTLAASIAAVPLIFINFGPYYLMYNVAGEVKNARKSFLLGAWGAILLSAAMAFLLTFLLDRAIGIDFVEAYTVSTGYAPVVSSFLAYVVPNLGVNVILAIVLLVSNIGFGYLGFMFLSRPMLSWSFDRILPSGLSSVSSRFNSPTVAILVTLVLASCGWTLELFNSSFASVILDSLLIKFVGWAIISAAAVVFPFTQRRLFQDSSVNYRIGGVPVLSLAGLASFLVFVYFVVNSITTSVFYTPTADQGAFLAVLFVGALVYYLLASEYP